MKYKWAGLVLFFIVLVLFSDMAKGEVTPGCPSCSILCSPGSYTVGSLCEFCVEYCNNWGGSGGGGGGGGCSLTECTVGNYTFCVNTNDNIMFCGNCYTNCFNGNFPYKLFSLCKTLEDNNYEIEVPPFNSKNNYVKIFSPSCNNGQCTLPSVVNVTNCTKNSYCKYNNTLQSAGCIDCPIGRKNCDEIPSNGCEVNILNDNNNCGGCGITCTGGNYCNNGQCKPSVCGDGIIDPGEECDEGPNNFGTFNPWNINNNSHCLSNCMYNKCYVSTSYSESERWIYPEPADVFMQNCLEAFGNHPYWRYVYNNVNIPNECGYKCVNGFYDVIYFNESYNANPYVIAAFSGCAFGSLLPLFSRTNYRDYRCYDGIDNDNDGLIDYPNDNGCSSYNDDTEFLPSTTVPFYCGDNIVGIPGWNNYNCNGVYEQCDAGSSNGVPCVPGYNSYCTYCSSSCTNVTLYGGFCGNSIIEGYEQCDDGNMVSGDGCSATCQIEIPTISITNVSYELTSGCNPATKICGRDSTILVTVSYPGYTAPMNTNSTVKIKGQTQFEYCILNPTTKITTPKTNSLSYTYTITSEVFQTGGCQYNPLMNTTYDSKLLLNNVPISNTFNNIFNGFRLSECGDGTVDYIPSAVPPINESCDTINPSSSVWMTSACALVNSTHPGGIATCNQNTCQWVMSGCYKCGDGVVNPGEECDDGNTNNHDACNNTCRWTYCGDNIVNNPNGRPYVTSPIPPPFSGNFTEVCDDGNLVQTDKCANNCTLTYCGDNRVQWPNGLGNLGLTLPDPDIPGLDISGFEECDDSNNNASDLCNNCVKTYCGDGIRQWPNGRLQNGTRQYYAPEDKYLFGFEECDNGVNNGPNKRCNINCTKTYCGDGIIQRPNGFGQFENCEPLLNGSKCNPSTCQMGVCGDGIIDAGEECDNGGRCTLNSNAVCYSNSDCTETIPSWGTCDFNYPDGCSAYCTFNDCTIDYVKVSPECEGGDVCGAGDVLNIDIGFYGDNCGLVNMVQTDYMQIPGFDDNCMIQFNPLNGQLKGMTYFGSIGGGYLNYRYDIPNITDICAGKSLTFTDTAFYQIGANDDWIQRSSNILSNENTMITLDQCKQFGSVEPYYNYGVYSFDVIRNPLSNCYYKTCVDNAALNVDFLVEDKTAGIYLTDNSGVRTFYGCSIFEDYICPDDFEYNGACRFGNIEGGVCDDNGLVDADCKLKTPMKCGKVWNGTGYINTCSVPVPTPHKFCVDPLMCVYANETNGNNVTCNYFNSTVINGLGKAIKCSFNNTWCPLGYSFNGTHCVNPLSQCSDRCGEIVSVVPLLSNFSLLRNNSIWVRFLEDDNCFLKNHTTNRRRGLLWCSLCLACS
ncbi:MAG: hypothetical protein KatS3mg002_0759 [Candidatus Woesearchaeota archaeon]|nr:MAG: hypothetical protein KatS3mg002_0759 [Candidatus Woesearchaeota archaeon]